MATMSTYFLTVNPKPHSVSFSRKQFKTFGFNHCTPPPTLVLPPTTKFWCRKTAVTVVRASTTTTTTSYNDVTTAPPIRPGGSVESDRLPSDVRRRAMDAIDSGGRRVTVGDVASKAGLMLHEAQKSLQALAADTNGFLEVSDEGDVLYVFPTDYRSKLTAKSFWMKTEPLLEKGKMAAKILVEVSFGTILIASIVIVFAAIIVIMASGSSKSSKSRKRGSRSSSSSNSSSSSSSNSSSSKTSRRYKDTSSTGDSNGGGGMNFIECVFSFVFGDGDPNQGIEEKRWKLIGQYIASNGGVVAAEELAPYLDLGTAEKEDDSYILPVLLRFDGQPEVDEVGNILYSFPSLQRTAAPQRSGRKEDVERRGPDCDGEVENFLKERNWQLSKTSALGRAMVIGFGGLNLVGVIILGTMLKDMTVVPNKFISFVSVIFPLLQIYAGSFFAIPLVRWLFVLIANRKITKRNLAREHSAKALESMDLPLRLKILNARDMAQRTFIGADRIVYSTERDLYEQDYNTQEWDRRLEEIVMSD